MSISGCAEESVRLDPDGGIDRGGNGGIDRGGNGGVDRGGVSRGTITGFSSVFVNGIEYDTSGASITLDERTGSEDDLEVGHVVTVFGSVDRSTGTGRAERIVYDASVAGPISMIDIAARQLQVLGQPVRVSAATRYGKAIPGGTLEGLGIGTMIEVSGHRLSDGSLLATRIDPAEMSQFEISGTVAELNTGAMTFQINTQPVAFGGATLQQFPAGGLAPGQYVEVVGSAVGEGGQFVATRIELHEDGFEGDEGYEVELEGVITRFVSATEFDVAANAVRSDSSTQFRNGAAGDLAAGVVVEIEGELDAAGVVVAEVIILQPEPAILIASVVEAVDVDASTITLLGNVVLIDERTSFEDHSVTAERFFGRDGIGTGQFVEVRAFEAGGALVAAAIERDDDEGEIEVEGIVEAVEEYGLMVRGIVFQTTPETSLAGPDGEALPREAFFALVAPGVFVEAEGVRIGDGVAVATAISIDD